MPLNVVLYEPEIAPNTGNIIRLCANTGCRLHLIEPLGFAWDDKRLRRAGLNYQGGPTLNSGPVSKVFIDSLVSQQDYLPLRLKAIRATIKIRFKPMIVYCSGLKPADCRTRFWTAYSSNKNYAYQWWPEVAA